MALPCIFARKSIIAMNVDDRAPVVHRSAVAALSKRHRSQRRMVREMRRYHCEMPSLMFSYADMNGARIPTVAGIDDNRP